MFEHIYFFTHQADGENQEVLEDEAYQKMAKKHHLPPAEDTAFCAWMADAHIGLSFFRLSKLFIQQTSF